MSIEDVYRATSRKLLKRNSSGNFWEKVSQTTKGTLFIGGRVPKFELLGIPATEFSKKSNLMSIEDTYRATGSKNLKEIRRENVEKGIVEKWSLLHTNDYIETGTQVRPPGYPN